MDPETEISFSREKSVHKKMLTIMTTRFAQVKFRPTPPALKLIKSTLAELLSDFEKADNTFSR